MSERDRTDEERATTGPPLEPVGAGLGGGSTMVSRTPAGDDEKNEVRAEEDDRDAIEGDADLADPASPEFDHSLRRRQHDPGDGDRDAEGAATDDGRQLGLG